VFTRYLVEAIRTGAADLDEDDGRILIARNVHWTLPVHLRYAIESPIAAQRLGAVDGLAHLRRVGNDVVRAAVDGCLATLAHDDSRSVSGAATAVLEGVVPAVAPAEPAIPAQRAVPPVVDPAPVDDGVPGPAPTPAPAATPASASTPAPAAAPVREPGPPPPPLGREPSSRGRTGRALLLVTLVAAGGLLTASRFAVFESTYGYHAVSLGWSTPTWVVQVLLPVVLAVGALLAGTSLPWGAALAGGLAGGVLLSVVSQLLMSLAVTLDTSVGYGLGPAWWLTLMAALLLAVGVVAVVASSSLGSRPPLRRNRSSAVSALPVVVSAVAWIVTGPPSVDFGWWLYIQFAGLLLCAACLPVAVLDLNAGQRVFGLAVVTTTGAWLVSVAVEALLVRPSGYQPGALASGLLATLLAVGGACLGGRR
jgi:hypothetical protein